MDMLKPPNIVRGMTILDREKFKKIVKMPTLHVCENYLNSILPHMKPMILKLPCYKSVIESTDGDGAKRIRLHPNLISCFGDLPEEIRNVGLNGNNLHWEDVQLKYEQWNAEDVLTAVIPAELGSVKSYSIIGHIAHLNLKPPMEPYKKLIGEVLCDKVRGIRTVINKTQQIENTYRNFHLELLCGTPEYGVEVKENGVTFEFDFSEVYWNPRLATEHERIIKLHGRGDVLYDVFAGVGPFSIPVARRKAFVLANDLNPASYKWLQHNAKKNKVLNHITTYNKDGREFIASDVKGDLLQRWADPDNAYTKFHITMNLPAMAVDFLDTFCGLLCDYTGEMGAMPLVHVYCFAKGDDTSIVAKHLVEENLGFKFTTNLDSINFVRTVAPNKDMYRISFYLTPEILSSRKCGKKRGSEVSDSVQSGKKLCN